jgi:hypothetical protein
MLELEHNPCSGGSAECSVNFTDKPYLNGPNNPDEKGKLPIYKQNNRNHH